MALAFLANMAMAAAPVIKDALVSSDISLQQLLHIYGCCGFKADNTVCQPFFILKLL